MKKSKLAAIDDIKTFPSRVLGFCFLYYGKASYEKYALPNVTKKFRLENPTVTETITDSDVETVIGFGS